MKVVASTYHPRGLGEIRDSKIASNPPCLDHVGIDSGATHGPIDASHTGK